MILRPYQLESLKNARKAFNDGVKSVCVQAPTGSGKTVLFCEITRLASELGNLVWVIVPRNELLEQSSATLLKFGVKHGRIAVGYEESKAFGVHVVSKDTLIRRLDKIKKAPDLVIIDEAHLALDRYLKFKEALPDTRWIGVTATPERLDGRGLHEMYDRLILGPSIKELIEAGYLANMRYFCPPLPGVELLHRRGTDYDQDELETLLNTRKIYGKAIEHYKKYADGKPCLVFCRSLKASNQTAQQFVNAGYKFENIDGTMTHKKRSMLIDALRDGRIHGLTSCELITYGLDVPRVGCVIMLRPTLSRTLFMQMVGRGLRPETDCVVLDHVGNLQLHGHPVAPYEWKFYGEEKQTRKRDTTVALRLCPELDYMYCDKPTCAGCEHNKENKRDIRIENVETELVEAKPVPLKMRPIYERKEINDRIILARESGSVKDMLAIAEELGNQPMWAYWEMNRERRSVNVPILSEIARQCGYKPGWIYFKKQEIQKRLYRK